MVQFQLQVRAAEWRDVSDLLILVEALAGHHGDKARVSLDALSRDVLGDAAWLRVLVAECDGTLVGYAAVYSRAHPMQFDTRGLDLHHLYVDPAFRGAGIGRRLIEASIDLARALHCAYVVVGTQPQNHAAQAVYVACGFEAQAGDGSRFCMMLKPPASA